MGLLGKTLNDRSTLKQKNNVQRIFKEMTEEEINENKKMHLKKFNHLKCMLEKEKVLNKVNRHKLLSQWIDTMKEIKANQIIEEINHNNNIFEQ